MYVAEGNHVGREVWGGGGGGGGGGNAYDGLLEIEYVGVLGPAGLIGCCWRGFFLRLVWLG